MDKTARVSMPPLVHVWARDRLSESLQQEYWVVASHILATSITWTFQASDYEFRRTLVPHIDSCISLCKDESFVDESSDEDRIDMAAKFALAFGENGRLQSAMELNEKVLEARQWTLGSEHPG